MFSIENSDLMLASKENEIEEFVEEAAEQEQISRIFKEIAFLSKAYREVMVMFYIDELKVKEIATRLPELSIFIPMTVLLRMAEKSVGKITNPPKTQNGGTAFAVPPHYINTSLSHLG